MLDVAELELKWQEWIKNRFYSEVYVAVNTESEWAMFSKNLTLYNLKYDLVVIYSTPPES